MDKTPPLPYQLESAARGYPFACDCGEQFRTAEAAWSCRKCRSYLFDHDYLNRGVVDVRTGRPVADPR